jgi:UDP-glucose 4-epimerase
MATSRHKTSDRSLASEPARGSIVVTGISGRLGRILARRLHRDHQVVGIDRRPLEGAPKDVQLHRLDIRRKKCEDIFRAGGIRAVVHLNLMHDPRIPSEDHHSFNVIGTTKILEYCDRYQVPKVVILSSANIYGPRPENSNFLSEDAPLLGGDSDPGIRDLVEVDMVAQSFFWKNPQVETVILRPVHIVGSVRNAPSNYLRLPYVPTLWGFDPMVQLIHEEDVVEAIVCALRPGVRGVFNIVGPGEVPLSVVLRELGKPTLPIPHLLGRPLLGLLYRSKLTSFPPPELDHIRYVCMVDGSRAETVLGFRPRHSLKETIEALRE